jgi:hypothetical protein
MVAASDLLRMGGEQGTAPMSDGTVHDDAKAKPAVLARSRSLVFAERRLKPRSLARPPADFVAHLIACDLHLGEYRRAMREEPAVGLSRYHAPVARARSDFEIKV